jgi:ribonuclease HII
MPVRIDRRGLHRSNISLLRQAVMRLEVRPDYVLTDGFPVRRLPLPHLSIKKGDAVTASIAAASIVAKVQRDRMMERYHRRYPDFDFRSNKGYGTRHHWETLDRLGPTPIHRMSFKGVGRRWESVEDAIAAEEDQEHELDEGEAPPELAATGVPEDG